MHTRIFTSDSLQPSPLARQEGRRKLVSINDERVARKCGQESVVSYECIHNGRFS
jgi:hypothetical protein